MKILGIETSCDETSAAIIENGTKILSNVVASSKDLHEKTGGIIPEVAAREQVKCMIPVINETLLDCHPPAGGSIPFIDIDPPVKPEDDKMDITNRNLLNNIDAIAVTVGPGLIGSLLVGVETAKTLSFVTSKPVVPVNHIFAHIYANWLTDNPPQFPALALVVSGGHTELFLMKNHGQMKWLGGTRDDAAGEAFDKTARLLGLGYPGGPAIANAVDKYIIKRVNPDRHPDQTKRVEGSSHSKSWNMEDSSTTLGMTSIKLPRPMIDSDDLDFSFSGLKTAVFRELNKLKALNKLNNDIISHIAYEIQESITDVLIAKTLKAAQQYKVKSIILGGGVAANQRLKEKFQQQLRFSHSQPTTHHPQLFIPPPSLCTDNATYIASFAYFNFHPVPWQEIQAQPSLSVEV